MNFQTAVRTCLQKYVTFSGRASRSEYWWFALFLILGSIAFGILDGILFRPMGGPEGHMAGGNGPLGGLFSLAMLLPSLAAGARRLHDTDRSGWWLLIALVPLVGFLVLLYFFVQPSMPGSNRFGSGPGGSGETGPDQSYSRSGVPRVDRDD